MSLDRATRAGIVEDVYECRFCPVTSVDGDELAEHVLTRHRERAELDSATYSR